MSKSILMFTIALFWAVPTKINVKTWESSSSYFHHSEYQRCKITLDTIYCIVLREVLLVDSLGNDAGYSDCRSRLIEIPSFDGTNFLDTLDFSCNDFSRKKAPKISVADSLKAKSPYNFYDYFYFRYGNQNQGATFYEFVHPSPKKYPHIMAAFTCKMVVWVYRNCKPVKHLKDTYYLQSGYFIGHGDTECWKTKDYYYYSNKMAIIAYIDSIAMLNPAQERALKIRKSNFKTFSRSI